MKEWDGLDAVERQPGKVSGVWVFQGTRVPVSALFENLRDGATIDDFLEWFPGVTRAQIDEILKETKHQIERDESDLARIEADLAQFERDYEMSSADFWRLYQAGQMTDTADFMEWNALCKSQRRIQNRLVVLNGAGK